MEWPSLDIIPQNKREWKWLEEWKQYKPQILEGRCRCGRSLVAGLCSRAEGGCGDPPLSLQYRSPKKCICVPVEKLMTTPVPGVVVDGFGGQVVDQDVEKVTAEVVEMAKAVDVRPWQEAVWPPVTKRPALVRYILGRVAADLNCLGIVFGMPGAGKSYTALRVCELVDKTFCGRAAIDRIVYDRAGLMYWTYPGRLRPGQVLLVDEGGPLMSSKRSLSHLNQYLSEWAQTSRQDRAVVMVCVPLYNLIEWSVRALSHVHMKALGVFNTPSGGVAAKTEVRVARKSQGSFSSEVDFTPVMGRRGPMPKLNWLLPERVPLDLYAKKKFESRVAHHDHWDVVFAEDEKKELGRRAVRSVEKGGG